ncbi:TRAP-type C4-dicarboxylate transport system, small permease component [Desulfosporosinus orientis DSM 765]|uniref:TRAP-type C4-dicarboxylate transport system, small permease component n=1 Tax=Desulfosporosinus orientis (strain ATCC 19365 / DSM 765 / NCIMB 8382 / VKM B-1628 / Singapore I) TaxID=768706 RepID=G7WG01_DESOD|nr:TRAP-type C4-dicarboxylate transport system, small permease component [Desulfosporosinus orientis DSM 765]
MSDQVKRISSVLDKLAGLCIFSVMLLIVANIVLRTVFSQPILGTYELVGFLTALGVAFALAHCAFHEGHIAVSFIIERFPRKIQSITEVLVNIISLLLWAAAAWALTNFAQAMKLKKLVSPSAEIPVYPFIYLVALGLMGLCLVIFVKFYLSLRRTFGIGAAKKVTQ